MAEWRSTAIQSVASRVVGGPFGSSLGRKHYENDGVPVIRGAQMGKGRYLRLDDLVFVSLEKATKHTGNLAFPEDLVVTQRGTLGQVAIVPSGFGDYDRFLLSQSQMAVTADPSQASTRFLYYALTTPEHRERLTNQGTSSGVPHINLKTLRAFEISLPNVGEQRRIAAVLSAFDDLIEINERRIELLEDLARSLYREWFVNFRFPGHEHVEMVDSELGPIPEGWGVGPLANLASQVVDGDWIETKDQGGSDYRLLQVSNIGKGRFVETGKYRFVTQQTFERLRCTEIKVNDVLISRMPKPIGRAWLVDDLPHPAITAVDVAILRPRTHAEGVYASYWLNSAHALARAEAAATGTTRKRVSRSVLASLPVAVPPPETLEAFESLLGPLSHERAALNATLAPMAATRDLLLPRLVTGKLDISDVDLRTLTPPESE